MVRWVKGRGDGRGEHPIREVPDMHIVTRAGGRVWKSTFPDHQVQAYESDRRPFDGFCVVRSGHASGHRRIASASASATVAEVTAHFCCLRSHSSIRARLTCPFLGSAFIRSPRLPIYHRVNVAQDVTRWI